MKQLIPDTTPDARLDALKQFLEFWLGPWLPEYGEPSENLERLDLPDPLRRFLAFAGRWPPVDLPRHPNRFCIQDALSTVGHTAYLPRLHTLDGRLIFVTENQGVWEAGTCETGSD